MRSTSSFRFVPALLTWLVLTMSVCVAETFPIGDLFTGEVLRTSSNASNFVAAGAFTVFTATDQVHGSELWRTDGTPLGTELLVDIAPGRESSGSQKLIQLGDQVYFIASTLSYGRELWKTDGTVAGTMMVADIWPGPTSSNPTELTVLGDTLIFVASTEDEGQELWKLPPDGPPELITDLEPGGAGSSPRDLIAMGNQRVAYTGFTTATGRELVTSDGTEAGTKVYDIDPTGSSNAKPLGTAFDFLLYFEARTDDFGEEVWRLSPSSDTIARISDVMPGPDSSSPTVAIVRGTSLFVNLDSPSGRKLYRSNLGATVEEWAPVAPIAFGLIGSDVLFVNGDDLWFTDGLTPGAQLLASPDVQSVFSNGEDSYLIPYDGQLYFFGDGGLWRTDGTVQGTSLIDSLSWLFLGTLIGTDNGLFASFHDNLTGVEPWMLNGSSLQRLGDLNRDIGNSDPTEFVVHGDRVYFAADADDEGRELMSWDGSATDATVFEDLQPGENSSTPRNLIAASNSLYYRAFELTVGTEIRRIVDPLLGSTAIDIDPVGSSNAEPFAALGDEVFFVYDDDTSIDQLWITDNGAPIQLSNITGGSSDGVWTSEPPVLLGDELFFAARDDRGLELWHSDGTTADLFTDINIGPSWSFPDQLVAHNGWLYWAASDDLIGQQLWRTDGTIQNLSAITTAAWPLAGVGPDVLIAKTDAGTGREPWKTDGGPPSILRDISPGDASSLINLESTYYATSGGKTFFTALDPTHGYELWMTDGTPGGTELVRDIVPGPESSRPRELTPLPDGELAFVAFSPASGWELWRTDGTTTGTRLVGDIVPGAGSSDPESLTVYQDWVVFQARSDGAGREPWAYVWNEDPLLFEDNFESGDTSAWSLTVQ